jgi:hypothetical protein
MHPIWKAILLETQGKTSCGKFDTTRTYLQAQRRSISVSHMHARTHTRTHKITVLHVLSFHSNLSLLSLGITTDSLTTAQHWCLSSTLKNLVLLLQRKCKRFSFFNWLGGGGCREQHLGLQCPLFFEKFVLQVTTTHHVTQNPPHTGTSSTASNPPTTSIKWLCHSKTVISGNKNCIYKLKTARSVKGDKPPYDSNF